MVSGNFPDYAKAAFPALASAEFAPAEPFPALAAAANGRDTLPTNEAATAINRAPQTLRKWACLENGPIRPVRINGRLAWRVADLRSLLSGGAV